jgi:iron(III) transport system ATP-binding protein
MAVLRFEAVHFAYENRAVLAGLSFEARAGELLVILGPSGSGKSTALRLAAGLDPPGAGSISLRGRPASAAGRILMAPAERRVSLVFQDLALWPHMTSDEQIRFMGPRLSRAERERVLRDLGLVGFQNRLPAHMSGGERQRLALARALAAGPEILLLDEPFANLDPGLRVELRRLLLDLHHRHQVTIVYVTHDLVDALALADRVAILNEGRLEQTASAEEVYRRPATAFVATFVGKAAILPATLEGNQIRSTLGSFPNPRPDLRASKTIQVVFRPEDIEVEERACPARVEEVVFEGDRYLVRAATESGPVWVHVGSRPAPGDVMGLRARRGWPIEGSA